MSAKRVPAVHFGSANVALQSFQPVLLVAMLMMYFLWPGRVSILNTSIHGAMLALSTVIYLASERKLNWPLVSVYAPFVAGIAIAAVLAPDLPGSDALRPVIFGLISSYLFAHYGQRTEVFDYVRRWLTPIVCAFAVFLAMLPFTSEGLVGDSVASWLLSSVVERGLFFILATVLLCLASLRSRSALLATMPFLIAIFLSVMLTSLRGIWVATGFSLVAFAVLTRRARHFIVVGLVFAGVFLFAQRIPAITQSLGYVEPLSTMQDRVSDLAVKSEGDLAKPLVDLSNAGRLGYWRAGVDMWREHPWAGVGLGRFPERSARYAHESSVPGDAEGSFEAHNTFVSMLAETGVLGFSGFMAMVAAVFYKSVQYWRRSSGPMCLRGSALIALAVAVTAVGLTWDVHLYRLWWIGMGLALGYGQSEWRQSS